MTLATIVRLTVLCAAVVTFTACGQPVSPVQPSPMTPFTSSVGSMSLISPNQATAIANAVGHCRGPVLTVLRTVLAAGTLVSWTDDGSTCSFELSSVGHTSSHEIEYTDDASPQGLSCGDTVTTVDGVAP